MLPLNPNHSSSNPYQYLLSSLRISNPLLLPHFISNTAPPNNLGSLFSLFSISSMVQHYNHSLIGYADILHLKWRRKRVESKMAPRLGRMELLFTAIGKTLPLSYLHGETLSLVKENYPIILARTWANEHFWRRSWPYWLVSLQIWVHISQHCQK